MAYQCFLHCIQPEIIEHKNDYRMSFNAELYLGNYFCRLSGPATRWSGGPVSCHQITGDQGGIVFGCSGCLSATLSCCLRAAILTINVYFQIMFDYTVSYLAVFRCSRKHNEQWAQAQAEAYASTTYRRVLSILIINRLF